MMVLLLKALAAIATSLSAGLAYRAFAQFQNKRRFTIQTGNGIDEALFVRIGGIDQWIQIRGENLRNPILLVLHGGVALSYMAFTPIFKQWEKYFTIVQWDRRGVGKTFGRNRSNHGRVTLEDITRDGVELVEWLLTRLQKDKVILVGHSMGSIVGVLMAQRRPDLFHAYVGCEQVVSMAENEVMSYQMLRVAFRSACDKRNLKALQRIGPPPYPTVRAWIAKQRFVRKIDPVFKRIVRRKIPTLLLFSPTYSFRDLFHFIIANRFPGEQLFADWMMFDPTKFGTHFEVPVFIIQGERDLMAPTKLAYDWFLSIDAPDKAFELIKSAGHLVMFTAPELVLERILGLIHRITVSMAVQI